MGGGGQNVRANPWWMCEKDRDQLIGKTDCRTQGEGMEGSVGVCCGVEGGCRIGFVCGTNGEDNGERRGCGECHTLLLCGSVNRRVPRVSSRLPSPAVHLRAASSSHENRGPQAL